MRSLAYVAGALVAFGMGTTAAILVGWQRGPATSDSGGPTESSTLEDTVLETTSNAKNANPDKVSFVHRATDENSSGDYTYLSEPTINGDANAIVVVEPTLDRRSRGVLPTITTSVFGTRL